MGYMKKNMYVALLLSMVIMPSLYCIVKDERIIPTASFGYSVEAIEQNEVAVARQIKNAQIQRAAVIGLFGAAAVFYAYSVIKKIMYYQPPVTIPAYTMDWGLYGKHILFSAGELAGQFCTGSLMNHYAGNLLKKCDISFDYAWFIRSCTQLTTIHGNLKEELEHLPLIDNAERVKHKLEDVRCQNSLFVRDVMHVIAYMQYRKKLEEVDNIFASVMMDGIIKDMHTITGSFCTTMENLLNTYNPVNTTAQDYADAIKMSVCVESFAQDVYRNIKTFGVYEKGIANLGDGFTLRAAA